MVDTIRRSYRIFRQSLTILSKDKEILVFPFLSGILTILAFGTMVFSGLTSGLFEHLQATQGSFEGNILGYALLFVWYFVSWFIVLFFNVAVIHCAKMRLDGADPSVADGFRAGHEHLCRIAMWALVSATVVSSCAWWRTTKWLGKLVAALVAAYGLSSRTSHRPVMIFENRSLRDSISQSPRSSRRHGERPRCRGGIGAFRFSWPSGTGVPDIGMLHHATAAVIGLAVMVLLLDRSVGHHLGAQRNLPHGALPVCR